MLSEENRYQLPINTATRDLVLPSLNDSFMFMSEEEHSAAPISLETQQHNILNSDLLSTYCVCAIGTHPHYASSKLSSLPNLNSLGFGSYPSENYGGDKLYNIHSSNHTYQNECKFGSNKYIKMDHPLAFGQYSTVPIETINDDMVSKRSLFKLALYNVQKFILHFVNRHVSPNFFLFQTKTYTCTFGNCGKVFYKKWNFSLHMKMHLKIKQFKCSD